MRAWPVALGMVPEPAEDDEPDTSISGLAERCAQATAAWGEGDGAKVAARLEPSLLLKAPDAHPLALMLVVLDRYGPEVFEWAPEVLRVTMMRDNLQVSGASFAKLMAAEALLRSPSPWRQWNVFHYVCRALAGIPPNFVYLEQPDIGQQLVAVDVMKVCDPKQTTSSEVDKFVAATLRQEGQAFAPETLSFAQRELEQPRLRCLSCDAMFEDNNDQKCVTCGSTRLTPIPYPFAVLRDECVTLWRARRDLPLVRALDGLPETVAGNLVHDLLPHWDYAVRTRRTLLTQLRGLSR